MKATEVVPIATADYPTKAKRPANSRLDLARLKDAYRLEPSTWESALSQERDAFAILSSPNA